ncbi:MAG TPA: hypothetical protein VJN18_08155 [Polyangiaceae bacterium]|nr:hypothetical protein [Polyangiaceae bacterium]
MQTKSSYGVLKWAFLAGVTACLASACVVSSGDGNDDDTDIIEGGDGGTSTTTGGKSTGGKSSGGAGSGGTHSSGAPTTDGGDPGMGGAPPSGFVPGICQGPADEAPTPTVEPTCDAVAGDSACIACVKLKACPAYQTCFGEAPHTACSVGATEGAPGQFVCVSDCYKAGVANAVDLDMLLQECSVMCDDCADGLLNDETGVLIGEARMTANCEAECFPTE